MTSRTAGLAETWVDGELHLGGADLAEKYVAGPFCGDGLATLGCPELDGDVAGDCGHRLGVLGVNSQAQALCRHRAVHCARVQEREAKAVGDGVCDGGTCWTRMARRWLQSLRCLSS